MIHFTFNFTPKSVMSITILVVLLSCGWATQKTVQHIQHTVQTQQEVLQSIINP